MYTLAVDLRNLPDKIETKEVACGTLSFRNTIFSGPSYTYVLLWWKFLKHRFCSSKSRCSQRHPLVCYTRRSPTEHIWSPTSKLFRGNFSRYKIFPAFPTQPLDWKAGAKYFHTVKYANACDNITRPFIGKEYSSIEEIECDLQHICTEIVRTADLFIPRKKVQATEKIMTKLSPIYAGKVAVLLEAGRTLGDHDQVPLLMREKNARKMFAPMWRNVELIWYANRFKNGMKWSNKTMKGGLNNIILKLSVPSSSQMARSFLTHPQLLGRSLPHSQGDSNEHLHLSQQRVS